MQPARSVLSRIAAVGAVGALIAAVLPVDRAVPVTAAPEPAPAARVAAVAPVRVAADLTTAARAARQQGSRVEVAGLRTEDRQVFAEPSGRSTAEFTAGPVRVRRGASWAKVDTTLSRQSGMVSPRAAAADLAFSAGGTAPLVSLGKNGRRITLTWPGRLPAPRLAGDTATYAEVRPGVDLVMRAQSTGYIQHLVVKTPAAARGLDQIRLGMRADGVRVTTTKTGGLEARGPRGDLAFTAPPSAMWDSAPKARRSLVKVSVTKSALTIAPDQRLLRDPKAKFPIIVDPNWATYGKSFWTSVSSGKGTTPYPNTSPGGSNIAQVGKCYPDPDCNGIGVLRSYFQFDTQFDGILVGKRILGAWLDAPVTYSPACLDREHKLFGTSQVGGGLTWNSQPGGWEIARAWVPRAYSPGGCGGTKLFSFELPTAHVNPGSTSTYFIAAAEEHDGIAWRKFNPHETKLRIRFNATPNAPGSVRSDPLPPEPCRWCEGKRYFSGSSMRLIAGLSDPDGEANQPQWDIYRNNVLEARYGSLQANGSFHDTTISLADGQTVDWYVRGWDVDDWNNNSRLSASPRTHGPAPFVVDRTPPSSGPKVTGQLYPEDNRWHGGAGVPGTFTLERTKLDPPDAGTADVDHYLWGTQSPPTTPVDADALGGKASIVVTPAQDGPQDLFVRSVDRAGNKGPITTHRFYVRAGSGPLAQWSFEGDTKDTAFLGDRHGTLNGTARYGPGAVGLGLSLDGQQHTTNMTAPNTVRTDSSLSVSAWVKPQPTRTGQVMSIVSQDGTSYNSGFYLQYRGDMNKWAMLMLHDDGALNPPGTLAASAAAPQLGRWTHLTGVYDRLARQVRLYVNGVKVAEESVPANYQPWHASGPLLVGRQKCGLDPCDPWSGSIDEVKVYDRVLTGEEIRAAVGRDNVQTAHWTFDEDAGGISRNQVEGGEPAVLQNGATLTGPNETLGRAVQLDGVDDYAATSDPVVRTDQSYSVAAWVKLDRAGENGWAYTALSQRGSNVSGFFLGYRRLETRGVWEFHHPSADAVNRPADESVFSTGAAQIGVLTHLAAVYDAPAKQIRLYVNGALAGTAPRVSGFDATGPLQLGRGLWNGMVVNSWPGLIDEVRTYNRDLSLDEIRGIVASSNVSAGAWKLDGDVNDSSGNNRNGSTHGTPTWIAGHTTMPTPADRAVQLNGADAYLTAPHAVEANHSFSVGAWIRPDRLGSWWVPLSQDGNTVSAFKIQLSDKGHWTFTMFGADATNGGTSGARAIGPLAQVGVWQHVVGVYDADRKQISIYVNGVLSGTAAHTQTWNHATGRFVIGADKWNGLRGQSLPGAIDDVTAHQRVLFAEEIVAMAGRDLGLAHNWALDEASGNTVADSVGARSGTASGPGRVPGRAGGALSFDGVDDTVSTTGVDLDTSKSFTVASWVKLRKICDRGTAFSCKYTAVSMDGGQPSKFRLGHLVDGDSHPFGAWVFEMPEADGTVTKASVSAFESDLNTWVHLVGVYDAASKQLWLYVNATRQDHGVLDVPWSASGGLQLGRGRAAGAAAEFWPGEIDDVRLYATRLDKNRIEQLYASYPAPTS